MKVMIIVALGIILFALCVYVADYIPVDFAILRGATRAALTGGDPYSVQLYTPAGFPLRFYNPPWILPLLIPFTVLPVRYGIALMWWCAIVTYGALLYGKPKSAMFLVLTSAPVVSELYYGQVAWLAWLGLLLPRPAGLLLLMLKPQIGFTVAAFWVIEAWKKERLWGVIELLWPLGALTLVSFVAYGFWPAGWGHMVTGEERATLWPLLVPVGIWLFVRALRKDRQEDAIVAAPFIAPHVWIHSMAGCLMQLRGKFLLVAYVLSWVVQLGRDLL